MLPVYSRCEKPGFCVEAWSKVEVVNRGRLLSPISLLCVFFFVFFFFYLAACDNEGTHHPLGLLHHARGEFLINDTDGTQSLFLSPNVSRKCAPVSTLERISLESTS